ncbi:MAG: bacteriohemerythrin [Thermincola sp.]|jgi:hemerythrin|nr:bacteriohemerythrin [Thermincola sp.]MDT3703279.1 bacteriohemerythrin [Thermincola sp.]
MAYITLDEKYSVGVKEIDLQHQKLVELINSLHDAMKEGKGKDVLARVIQELVKYAASHFATEEKYMTKFNYPGYSAHKAEHEKFVKQVVDFQKDFDSGKAVMTLEVMSFLKDWLVKHILGTDKKYTSFFNEHGLK